MLFHRLRRRPNIKITLVKCLVLAGPATARYVVIQTVPYLHSFFLSPNFTRLSCCLPGGTHATRGYSLRVRPWNGRPERHLSETGCEYE